MRDKLKRKIRSRSWKYMVCFSVMFCLVGVVTEIIHATSYEYTFDVTVTKVNDGESSTKTKNAGYTRGGFVVDTMSVTGKNYEAWIEKSGTGSNVSKISSFSAPTSDEVVYIDAVNRNNSFQAKLNISTSLDTFQSCDMTGTWTPNAYMP